MHLLHLWFFFTFKKSILYSNSWWDNTFKCFYANVQNAWNLWMSYKIWFSGKYERYGTISACWQETGLQLIVSLENVFPLLWHDAAPVPAPGTLGCLSELRNAHDTSSPTRIIHWVLFLQLWDQGWAQPGRTAVQILANIPGIPPWHDCYMPKIIYHAGSINREATIISAFNGLLLIEANVDVLNGKIILRDLISECAMGRFRSIYDDFSLRQLSGGMTGEGLPCCYQSSATDTFLVSSATNLFLDALYTVLFAKHSMQKKVQRMGNVSALSPFIILCASFTTPLHNYPAAALNIMHPRHSSCYLLTAGSPPPLLLLQCLKPAICHQWTSHIHWSSPAHKPVCVIRQSNLRVPQLTGNVGKRRCGAISGWHNRTPRRCKTCISTNALFERGKERILKMANSQLQHFHFATAHWFITMPLWQCFCYIWGWIILRWAKFQLPFCYVLCSPQLCAGYGIKRNGVEGE